MKIAVVTDSTFWEMNQGAHQRIYRLLDFLNDLSELCIVYLGPPEAVDRIESAFQKKPSVISIPKESSFLLRLKKTIIRRWHQAKTTSNGPPLSQFSYDVTRRRVHEALLAFDPQVVIVEYLTCAFVQSSRHEPGFQHIQWVLDTIDVLSQRCLSFKSQGLPHWVHVTEKQERDILNSFDAIMAISREDEHQFRDMGVDTPILYCPHPASIEPTHNILPRHGDGFRIGYLSGRGVANLHGLTWFLEQVWPRITADLAEVTLHIAGAISDEIDLDTSDITIHGKVEDGAGFLRSCDMVINPVFAGGGMKIKCVEALSCGVPLLTTPTGAEGLADGIGQAFLCGQTPDEFCHAIKLLADDEAFRQEIARCGMMYVKETLGPETAFQELTTFLDRVDSNA